MLKLYGYILAVSVAMAVMLIGITQLSLYNSLLGYILAAAGAYLFLRLDRWFRRW